MAWNEGAVFLRSTDKDNLVSYTEHRCWDAKRFVKMVHAAAADSDGQVEQITEEDYRNAVKLYRRHSND